MRSLLIFTSTMMVTAVAQAGDLSGMWELQAIGQDGTAIQVENNADVIVLYRVMHPEFEGEKYTLEHLYKGRVINGKISGNLLVRDDPKAQFENLRPFDGQVKSDAYLIVDDLPLKLTKAGKTPLPIELPGKKKKKNANAAAESDEKLAQSSDEALLQNVLGVPGGESLLNVSARIRLPSPADDYTKAATDAEKAGKLAEAVEYYKKALEIDQKRLELYPRVGQALLDLKRADEAKKYFQAALRYDPNNKALRALLKKAQKG
ncbi:MAG: tetratricopeptide repeat protein [Deltaproteobacteria bacterium]|nr:tetratricopeptide repeat protein [Deltaproteobacteria bacterium]